MTTNVYNSNNSELKIQLVCALMDFVSLCSLQSGLSRKFFFSKRKEDIIAAKIHLEIKITWTLVL